MALSNKPLMAGNACRGLSLFAVCIISCTQAPVCCNCCGDEVTAPTHLQSLGDGDRTPCLDAVCAQLQLPQGAGTVLKQRAKRFGSVRPDLQHHTSHTIVIITVLRETCWKGSAHTATINAQAARLNSVGNVAKNCVPSHSLSCLQDPDIQAPCKGLLGWPEEQAC